jgi:hypothetical protein
VIDQILLHWRSEGSLFHSEQEWLLDELDRLRTAHDAAVEDAKKWQREAQDANERLRGEVDAYRLSDKIATARTLKAEAERDAALAKLDANRETFDEWDRRYVVGKHVGPMQERKDSWDAALATGREAGLREAAGIAGSYCIVNCKSHHDDAVDTTAYSIRDDILAAIPSPPKGCESCEGYPVCVVASIPEKPCHAFSPLPVCCEWAKDEDGYWNSSCGLTWMLNDGTPEDNEMEYCMRCSKPISIKAEEGKP